LTQGGTMGCWPKRWRAIEVPGLTCRAAASRLAYCAVLWAGIDPEALGDALQPSAPLDTDRGFPDRTPPPQGALVCLAVRPLFACRGKCALVHGSVKSQGERPNKGPRGVVGRQKSMWSQAAARS